MSDRAPSIALEMRQDHAEDMMLIDGYGDGGFRVKGRRFEGAILITGNGVWPVEVDEHGEPTNGFIETMESEIDILLIGRGETMTPLPKHIRIDMQTKSLPYDLMDTGAAARTYNVLLLEGRRVAALLKAI